MNLRLLALVPVTLFVAACGRAEADPVSLENNLPVEAMVVPDEERHAQVEADVAAIASQRDGEDQEEL